jgi:serine protease Do
MKNKKIFLFTILLIVFSIIGGIVGSLATNFYWQYRAGNLEKPAIIEKNTLVKNNYIPQTTEEEKVISAVQETSRAVVSIVITKDIPILEKYYVDPFGGSFWGGELLIPQYREKGTEKQKIGGGTGFIISKDGMILTNKHVLSEENAEYTVFLNDGQSYPIEILAKDPFYDLAVIKIKTEEKEEFPIVKLGDSSNLQLGQTVIAIGYALGEFENTVSTGVISGLGRSITAVSETGGFAESLEGVIQTDAAINPGNSGGPLLNLAGEVIGINVARSETAENIGFSLPINMAKRDIEQVKSEARIVYPYLGIYYTMLTEELAKANDLKIDYGAWVGHAADGSETEIAIISGTVADEAGLKRGDIILEFDGEKLNIDNTLAKLILRKKPGDLVKLKILRDGEEITKQVKLGEKEG